MESLRFWAKHKNENKEEKLEQKRAKDKCQMGSDVDDCGKDD